MTSKSEIQRLKKANSILKQDIQKLKLENENYKKVLKNNKQLEERISLLVESNSVGTWDFNLKTNKVIRNSKWAEQLGYTLDELNPDIFQFRNLVHPKDMAKLKRAEIRHFTGKQSYFKVEHRMKTKNGKWKWILNWGQTVKKDKNGEPIRIVGTHIDINEIKKVEERLRKSEKQYKALFKYAPIGLWEQDVTKLVEFIQNMKQSGIKDFREFFNKNPEKLEECIKKIKPRKINKAALKIHDADSLLTIQNNLDTIFTKKSKNIFKEQIISHANGESGFESETETKTLNGKIKKLKISMSFSYLPYRDRKVILFSISDITKQKAAEKSLVKSENKYKSLFTLFRTMADNLPDMIWAKDINKKYLFSNEAMCKGLLIAKNTEEPIGKTDLFFAERQRKVRPKSKKYHTFGELCQNSDDVVINSQQAKRFDEFGNVKNKFLFLDVYKAPFYDLDGNLIGTVGSARDITKEKEMENALNAVEEKYKKIFELVPTSILVTDSRGTIVDVNSNRENIITEKPYAKIECKGKKLVEASTIRKAGLVNNIQGLLHGKGFESREHYFPTTSSGTPGYFNIQGVPIIDNDKVVGAVISSENITKELLIKKEIENNQKQIRLFADHLELVREKERTNIAREIHDNLGQSLTALKIDLSWLSSNHDKSDKIIEEKIRASKELINSLIRTVQKISTELRPGIIDNLGLSAAIEWQVDEFQKRTGLDCDLNIVPKNLSLNEQLSVNIFRIIQETMTNIIRHANAKTVYISLKEINGTVKLKVIDDGVGITNQQINSFNSFGIMSIKERIIKFNGKVQIKGIKNKGTKIILTIPPFNNNN